MRQLHLRENVEKLKQQLSLPQTNTALCELSVLQEAQL